MELQSLCKGLYAEGASRADQSAVLQVSSGRVDGPAHSDSCINEYRLAIPDGHSTGSDVAAVRICSPVLQHSQLIWLHPDMQRYLHLQLLKCSVLTRAHGAFIAIG